MAPRAWWQYMPVAPSDNPDWSIQEVGEMVLVRGIVLSREMVLVREMVFYK